MNVCAGDRLARQHCHLAHSARLHVPVGGCDRAWVGPDYGDQTLRDRKSATAFSFAALLPDMAVRTKENFDEFTRPGGGDKVEGVDGQRHPRGQLAARARSAEH